MNSQRVRNIINKKFILIFIGGQLILNSFGYCQVNLDQKQAKWILSNGSGTTVVFNSPVFFRYEIYEFEIKSNHNSLIVECRNGTVKKKREKNKYLIYITDSSVAPSLGIFYIKNGKKECLLISQLKVYDLPITVLLANKSSGSKVNFKKFKDERFSAGIINYDINIQFYIESITITTLVNDSLISIRSNGNKISEEQAEVFEKLPNNQVVVFTVKIKKNDGSLSILEPIFFFNSHQMQE